MVTSHPGAAVRSAVPRLVALSLLAALASLCAGCKTDPTNPFLAGDRPTKRAGSNFDRQEEFATQPLDPELLASGDWFEKPPHSYAERTEKDVRWHHPGLDPHLHPSAPRTDLTEPLSSAEPVVATNAAIVVAHWGTGQPTRHLAAAIRSDKLPLPLRCASAEALGKLDEPSPAPTLRELLAEFAPLQRPTAPEDEIRPEIPDLHADLIRALARHAEAEDERWFNAAMADPAWQVRLEGVAAWSALADLSLPDQVMQLRADRDPRVRATAVRTIAAHRDPRAFAYLQQALDDSDFDVRVAAANALGEIGTADAKELVGRVKNRGAELQQAAAGAAQSARQLRDDVETAADDAQSQLRQAVAETLDQAEQRGQRIANETVASTQDAVRQATAQFETVADSAAQRVRETQQLVAALRAADLGDTARRETAAALERLAMDANLAVRVEAARAMGEVADPMFLPALVALLSDEADVQSAAMASLAEIAGSDVTARPGGRPLSGEERVRMWQLWYRERQDAAPPTQ